MASASTSARGRRRPRRPRAKPTSSSTATATSTSSAAKAEPSAAAQLVAAIRRDDLAALSSLLQTPELDVNRRSPAGDAPLVEACRFARLDMAAALLAAPRAAANVASSNRAANRVGLTPLVAACMALAPELVALLLAHTHQPVDLLRPFARVNAASVCLLFCVANGRAAAQADAALQILRQLLDHAQRRGQLQALLAARPDKLHSLVHVAAGLGNWQALRLLRDFGADLSARNAADHSALHVVELNAFQARSLQFCEPPRPEADAGRGKGRGRGRHGRKRQKKQDEDGAGVQKGEEEDGQEQQSEADKQTFTRSRPDRAVEAFHVTRTVLELVKSAGVGAVFSRKGDQGVRGLYIKALVLAEVGLVPILNEIAEMADTQKEKAVYMDGLMYTVASVYPLSVKNAKEYQSLWRQALDKKSSDDLEVKAAVQGDEEEKQNVPQTLKLSHEAFKMVLNGMLSYNSLSKRVKVWTLILMHLVDPYAGGSPLAADKQPVMEECGQLKFFERITDMLCRSGTKLAFCIFDRTDIEDDESYDEEIEFHLLISLVELFLQFFAPYARAIRIEGDTKALGITASFQQAIKPIKQLWPLVNAALGSLDDAIATPQRFTLLLHLLQVFEQLEAAFVSDENAALAKLFAIMNRFVKQEAKKKHIKMFVAEQTQLLRKIATSFPIPSTFIDKITPLKGSVDVLIRSDPKVLGMDLYSFASIPGLIRLEHKVDYLAMLAEERNGSVSVSISRASEANYVDFILQQILSTSASNLKGEMNITLVNEPGVGVGVTREFFQIVQRYFFSTIGAQTHGSAAQPAPHVLEIGAQWLQLARQQSPKDGSSNKKRNDNEKGNRSKRSRPGSGGFAELFPLFDFVDKQGRGVLTIAPRPAYVSKHGLDAKRKEKGLSLTKSDLIVDSSEVDALKKAYLCIGRLMGLAIRNHQPLAADFPLVFWRFMMRDGSLSWEDYCENSDVFKRSLQFVLDHDFDVEPLDMRFEYTMDVVLVDEEAAKQKEQREESATATAEADSASSVTTTMEMELQKGMGDVEVTNANKAQYVMLRAQQYFFGNGLIYYQKMRDGFTDTIVKSDLKLFRPEELRSLVRGERTIDFEGLKKSVVYSRGMSPSCGVIQHFWEIAESFDQETRSKLLTFWSGSPLPPIFGFDSKYRSMNADTACWYIDVDTRMQASFCPMANTCDRRLILPDYPTSAVLKEKLLVALEHGSVGYDRM